MQIRRPIAAALLFVAGLARAETTVDVAGFAARSRAERYVELYAARLEIDQVRKNRNLERAQRDVIVDRLAARLAELENPLAPYYAREGFTLRQAAIGQIGYLEHESVEVFQVLDVHSALVEKQWNVLVRAGRLAAREAGSIGPDRSLAPLYDERGNVFWLAGINTTRMSDGERIELDGVYAVTRTETYDDADNGTTTVLVLEPMDLTADADRFTRAQELRTWTSGTHQTEAIFVRYVRGRVTLMRMDGKTTDVPLAKLGEADRQYVRDQIRAAEAGMEAAERTSPPSALRAAREGRTP